MIKLSIVRKITAIRRNSLPALFTVCLNMILWY